MWLVSAANDISGSIQPQHHGENGNLINKYLGKLIYRKRRRRKLNGGGYQLRHQQRKWRINGIISKASAASNDGISSSAKMTSSM